MEEEIFYQGSDGLQTLSKSLFASESELQKQLAEHPDLLCGDEMQPDHPRRWGLVAREADVPDKQGGAERWSADHLFVDQDGIPTIIEVKRSDDSRIRRRVVGQILDYAAHARQYLEADGLRTKFEETNGDQTEEVYRNLGVSSRSKSDEAQEETSPEEFWQVVENNLRSGSLRLVFVADEVPHELREVVEYLNQQMRETEVFAVEVTRYAGTDQTAYAPTVYGTTAGGSSTTGSRQTPPSYEGDDFLGDIEAKEASGSITASEAEAMRELYRFIRDEADDHENGGSSNVTVKAKWDVTEGTMFSLSSTGRMKVWMAQFDFEEDIDKERYMAAEQWYDQLQEIIPGFEDKSEQIKVSELADQDSLEEFQTACLQFVSNCEAALGESR